MRNDESQIGADGIAQVQGKVSVTGAVISDGVTPIRISISTVRQNSNPTVAIQGAHVHGYQQLVGGGGGGGTEGGSTGVRSGNLLTQPLLQVTDTGTVPDLTQFDYLIAVGERTVGGGGVRRGSAVIVMPSPAAFTHSLILGVDGALRYIEFSFPSNTQVQLDWREGNVGQLVALYGVRV